MRSSRKMLLCAGVTALMTAALTLCILQPPQLAAGGSNVTVSAPAEPLETLSPAGIFRTERQKLRAFERARLNEVAYGSETDAELRQMAQRELMKLDARETQESTLEGMLALRGFPDSAVSVSDGAANVFINAEMLTQQECTVILDLVCRETGILGGNIKIIPIN